jgi:hypothetical protein
VIRKTLSTVTTVLSLLGLALPALGQTPTVPMAPAPKLCPAPASSPVLPALQPPPFFKTTGCGSCSDPGCPGQPLGTACGPGLAGTCAGIVTNGHVWTCPGTSDIMCTCLLDN